MKTSCSPLMELPRVEECVGEASKVTGELLGSCMIRQCRDITVTCSEWSRNQCMMDSQNSGKALLAFTVVL
jgi:hypothetical protein